MPPQYFVVRDRFPWDTVFDRTSGSTLFNEDGRAYLDFFSGAGVQVGTRVHDAGCGIPEKTLVALGDDCALNEGSIIQGHSLEDGTFKSGRIVLGNRCTVGVEAFLHYGVTMDDGSTVEADAFLMKGEDVPENTRYVGNPAREVTTPQGGLRPEPLPGGPRHRALTAGAGRPLLPPARPAHSNRAQRRRKAVRI